MDRWAGSGRRVFLHRDSGLLEAPAGFRPWTLGFTLTSVSSLPPLALMGGCDVPQACCFHEAPPDPSAECWSLRPCVVVPAPCLAVPSDRPTPSNIHSLLFLSTCFGESLAILLTHCSESFLGYLFFLVGDGVTASLSLGRVLPLNGPGLTFLIATHHPRQAASDRKRGLSGLMVLEGQAPNSRIRSLPSRSQLHPVVAEEHAFLHRCVGHSFHMKLPGFNHKGPISMTSFNPVVSQGPHL